MNCSCMAYTPLDIRGQGSGCVMWQTVLTDTKYIGGQQVLYVKVSKSELGEFSLYFHFPCRFMTYDSFKHFFFL